YVGSNQDGETSGTAESGAPSATSRWWRAGPDTLWRSCSGLHQALDGVERESLGRNLSANADA
ncbi:MAG TPA: hypothetical protein VFR88_06425, partial [Microlunatus sp.]|nr:hypothetical protein [Microlunatus sp.]